MHRLLSWLSLAVACATPPEQARSPAPAQAAERATPPVPSEPAAASYRAKHRFEVVLIDDASDRFRVSPDAELPDGVTLPEEHIDRSVDEKPSLRHFVHVRPRSGESLAQALARLEPWLRAFELPPDGGLGWQTLETFDDAGKPVFNGWRSFVLRGTPVLVPRDIASVERLPPVEGRAAVAITLSLIAAERFRRVTREQIGRRFAILLDGLVRSAPIIQSEIKGGVVQLHLGYGADPAEVERLVEGLGADAKQDSAPR